MRERERRGKEEGAKQREKDREMGEREIESERGRDRESVVT